LPKFYIHCFSANGKPDDVGDAKMKDITVIATLGVGGFGRVELVHMNINNISKVT